MNTTTQGLMLKAFGRAFLVTFLIIVFIVAIWHYTFITLALLCVAWFNLMLQIDPPNGWDC